MLLPVGINLLLEQSLNLARCGVSQCQKTQTCGVVVFGSMSLPRMLATEDPWLVGLGLTILAGLFSVYSFVPGRNRLKDTPLLPSLPLLGILPWITQNWERFPEALTEAFQGYHSRTIAGRVPRLVVPSGWAIYTAAPENVQHMLKNNFENYEKGQKIHDLYQELLGDGIFATDGAVWKYHRKFHSHLFSKNLLRATAKVTLSQLKILEEIFSQRGHQGVDVQSLFFQMTFDTTCYVALGCPIKSLAAAAAAGSGGSLHPFSAAFDELQRLIQDRWLDPFFQLQRLLGLSYRERRIVQLAQELKEYSSQFIRDRTRSTREAQTLGPDLLSRYLEQGKGDNQSSLQDLHWVAMNVLLAGRDTTAAALSWTLFELTKRPDVVEKIIEEIQQVCGPIDDEKDEDDGGKEDYSYDAIQQLKYTHAVVMEVLRLHPSVPIDTKLAVNDDVLPDGTPVPAGSAVSFIILAMGRSPELWGPTASDFDPNRFLLETTKEPSPFSYPVFNAGPRTCLGKPLALMTMKLTLAYLLPRFHFLDRKCHSGEPKWAFVQSMKGGFDLEVTPRTAPS